MTSPKFWLPESVAIDCALLGTLSYGELHALWKTAADSQFAKEGWRIDWYEDIALLVRERQSPVVPIAPYEFYERLYNVRDLGLFRLEAFGEDNPIQEVSIYVQDSILPSYQIRSRSRIISEGSSLSFKHVWTHIKCINDSLVDIAQFVGIYPQIHTWTVRLDSESRFEEETYQQLVDNRVDFLLSLLGEESALVESASVVGSRLWVVKILVTGAEQFLILDFDGERGFAISRLYYLLIGEERIKRLLTRVKTDYLTTLSDLNAQMRLHHGINQASPAELAKLARLRGQFIDKADDLRAVQAQAQLAQSFLEFHLQPFLEAIPENVLLLDTPKVIETERSQLDLFFLRPMRYAIQRTSEALEDMERHLSTYVEILSIQTSLRNQVLMERLEIIAVAIAMLALALSVINILM